MASQPNPGAREAASPSNLSIAVEKNPPEARLLELGVKSWPKWGCPPGSFPLKFDAEETCYLLKGKVKAYPKGSSECVEFGAGDLVVIPKGLSCTWEVLVAVDKHYKEGYPIPSTPADVKQKVAICFVVISSPAVPKRWDILENKLEEVVKCPLQSISAFDDHSFARLSTWFFLRIKMKKNPEILEWELFPIIRKINGKGKRGFNHTRT